MLFFLACEMYLDKFALCLLDTFNLFSLTKLLLLFERLEIVRFLTILAELRVLLNAETEDWVLLSSLTLVNSVPELYLD